MATIGPVSAGTGANDASVGVTAWTNPGNITASDDSRATIAALTAQSQYEKATNFPINMPLGGVPTSLLIEVEKAVGIGTVADTLAYLVKAGTIQTGDNQAAAGNWSTTEGYTSYTFDVSSWTRAEINDATSGFVLSATATGLASPQIDHVRATLTYTPAIESATTLGVGLARETHTIGATVSLVGSSTLAIAGGDSIGAAMILASSATFVAAPAAAQGTAMTMEQALTLGAAGVAGPSSSTIQQTQAAIDALPAVLTAAGVPMDAAVSFAAALQFIVVEPPNTYDSVFSLAAANGLTLAAQSVPQVSIALAKALGLAASSGFAFDSTTTLAAQSGIAVVAQQIVQTAVLTGAGLAILPVADGVFRSVVIGPVGLDALAAAQASPVAQLQLIAGMGLTTEAQAGWAAAIAVGIVLSIQQQAQAVQESMISLGATPAQAMSAAVAFQSMLALGVSTTCRADTAFGSPLTGSIVQIINEVYRVSDIQD